MRRIVILSVLLCSCAGCHHRQHPHRMVYEPYYHSTAEGLRPTQKPQNHLVQRCTPEAMESRTAELLADGYVIIGRAEFTNQRASHKEILGDDESVRAEIILIVDTEDSTQTQRGFIPWRSRPATVYRHIAVYFARPAAVSK